MTRLHSVRFIPLNLGWRPVPVTYEICDEAARIAEDTPESRGRPPLHRER
jgi:hypothetical protein